MLPHCRPGNFGQQAADLQTAVGDSGEMDPGPTGERIGMNSFIGNRGIQESAALALFDTAGAMAAWAEAGPGMYKASTLAIQTQVLAPPPRVI